MGGRVAGDVVNDHILAVLSTDADPNLFNDHGHDVTSQTPSRCPDSSMVLTHMSLF